MIPTHRRKSNLWRTDSRFIVNLETYFERLLWNERYFLVVWKLQFENSENQEVRERGSFI